MKNLSNFIPNLGSLINLNTLPFLLVLLALFIVVLILIISRPKKRKKRKVKKIRKKEQQVQIPASVQKKPSKSAKLKFYLVKGIGMIGIHIVPLLLLTYFLLHVQLITKIVIHLFYAIFDRSELYEALKLALQFFTPLIVYSCMGIIIWAILWPVLSKYFKSLYLDTDGILIKEGRVWWRAPNKITNKLKEWADKGGIDYKNESVWLYRTGRFINPFRPLSSLNKLYVPEDIKGDIEIQPKRIILHDLYILQYKDGYILSHKRFASKEISVEKLNKIIKEDSTRISKIVGDYALTNPELRVRNISSALFWVPPANLEVKEHVRVGSESVGFQILSELIEKYDRAKERALRDGVITSEEISNMLLPLFNQILLYANSMKAKGSDLLPDPPKLENNLITLEEMESYINEVRTAIATYENPEVFR